jgi:predicted nucleic acid-binding protein
MILIDTSVWIQIFKDKKGIEAKRIQQWLDEREVVLTRFNQLELLQGCRDNKEWLFSPIDCCIAQIAIENDLLLLHNDKDFNIIHQVRPLIHHRWQ